MSVAYQATKQINFCGHRLILPDKVTLKVTASFYIATIEAPQLVV